MTTDIEVNKMILERVRKSLADKKTKEFIEGILAYEQGVADEERPRFQEEYTKLVERYSLPKRVK